MSYRGISTEVIKLTGYKNDDIEAYVSKPAGDGPFPGICIIHHMPGWDEWTLELCWKFANRGFAVIAPHLYSRFGPGDPDDVAARARGFNGMSDDQVVGDVDASSRWLRRSPTATARSASSASAAAAVRPSSSPAASLRLSTPRSTAGAAASMQDASKLNEQQPVRRLRWPRTCARRCSASSATRTRTRRRPRSTRRRPSSSAWARPTSSTVTTAPATPFGPRTAIATARSRPWTRLTRPAPSSRGTCSHSARDRAVEVHRPRAEGDADRQRPFAVELTSPRPLSRIAGEGSSATGGEPADAAWPLRQRFLSAGRTALSGL